MTERRTILRLIVAAVMLGSALLGLGTRLAFLHLGDHDDTMAMLKKSRWKEREILADRGSILDRSGDRNVLALSLTAKHVKADPYLITKHGRVAEVAELLADELDLEADELAVGLNSDRRYYNVKRFVPDADLDRIRAARVPGIAFDDAIIRYYPHRDFLCHILGFVNNNGVGSAGIEQRADRYLRGCSGYVGSRLNALQQELYWAEGAHVPAIRGADITLTIDQHVQFMVEQALDNVMQEHKPAGAWAIVADVHTGEILALASRPSYDLNTFRESTENSRLNRALGYVYEPGSTFKAITFAAAFDQQVVSEKAVISCENGSWYHCGKMLRDYHPYGKLTVADGLKKSSNILTAKVALMLGKKRFFNYLEAFGIGHRLGIDLPGEEAGILHDVTKWSNISLSRIAIGQGVAVTALQVLGVYATIANDGYLMKPYVVKRIVGGDGVELYRREPDVIRRVIKPETSAQMCRLLARVTEDGGTGRRARVEGFKVAGKTGTAQKAIRGGYSDTDYVASFVGFLPATAPEIAIVVVVDTPQPIHTGGRVAGPVFGEIADQAVRYLNLTPAQKGQLAKR